MLPPFRLGLGGPIASGRQWFSWIHEDDETGILLHAIDGADGALNAVAPNPVTNAAFAGALGRALHRPAFLPVPSFAPRALLGEGAIVLNEGQRVLPGAHPRDRLRLRAPPARRGTEGAPGVSRLGRRPNAKASAKPKP